MQKAELNRLVLHKLPDIIDSHYQIRSSSIEILLGGTFSIGLRVHSEDRGYIFKTFKARNKSDILNEFEIYKHLNKSGISTTNVIPDSQGNSIIEYVIDGQTLNGFLIKDEHITVYDADKLSAKELFEIGKFIATFHNTTTIIFDLFKISDRLPTLNLFEFSKMLNEDNKLNKLFPKWLIDELKTINLLRYTITNEPLVGLHSDLSSYHIGYKKNGDLYIYDFDKRAIGSRYADIAAFNVAAFCSTNINFNKYNEICRSFVKGYELNYGKRIDKDELLKYTKIRTLEVILQISYYIVHKPNFSDEDINWANRCSKFVKYLNK